VHKERAVAQADVYSHNSGGKKTLLPIRSDKQAKMEKWNGFHRQFRKARARFILLVRKVVELSRQLETEQLKAGDALLEREKSMRRRDK